MADQMTDGDLTEIAERHGTRIYGHHVRAEWAYYEIPALIAEVRRLGGEHAAMLDAIEAAEGYLKLDLRCRTLDDAGRLADALDRVRETIGDNRE